MKLEIPHFAEKKKLFEFLVENKNVLIAQKMNTTKHADAVMFHSENNAVERTKNSAQKSEGETKSGLLGAKEIIVKGIWNTTLIMDSHKDVHYNGIWNKTIKENPRILHVQEHKSHEFKSIISSGADLEVYTKTISWKEAGYDVKGETEALMFKSIVKEERNPYMFKQYASGLVDNHSVGMRYVKIKMAINDEDFEEEHKEWKKNIDKIANKEHAEQVGYFFGVYEAKLIEGSAVPIGSNHVTPTISVEPSKALNKEEVAKALLENRKRFIMNF